MSVQSPIGRYYLRGGLRLIQGTDGSVLLKSSPLRAIRVNRPAASILERCRRGYPRSAEIAACDQMPLTFLDRLHQAGVLDWVPFPPNRLPLVSIVIPVYRRPIEIEACLTALQSLDYPADRLETIVVDDASDDPTPAVAGRFDVRLIVQGRNRGQSAARNVGVAAARGDIIAFLDSDCIARPGWLRELVPYFQDDRVALVGGRVGAVADDRRMDRYESVCSALDMGDEPVLGRGTNSVFYVPTCNMLIRRAVYAQVGGLDEGLHVGEDVDLCWRVMAAGHHLYYTPRGRVLHRHRSSWRSGFMRRFAYGTSEAVLYSRFPGVVKKFTWQPVSLLLLLCAAAAWIWPAWIWPAVMAGALAAENGHKRLQCKRMADVRPTLRDMLWAQWDGHFQLIFYLTFILVRYHLIWLIVLAVCLPGLIGLCLTLIFFPVMVTYFRKRPSLSLPTFAGFYLAEHAFYQCGAFWGAVKQRCFRLYRISFRRVDFMQAARRRPSGMQEKPARAMMRPS